MFTRLESRTAPGVSFAQNPNKWKVVFQKLQSTRMCSAASLFRAPGVEIKKFDSLYFYMASYGQNSNFNSSLI
jgi:hypothetical protein